MNSLVTFIQVPFLLVAVGFAAYILVLSIAPFVVRKAKRTSPTTKRKFAIIIPAHNEEKVIQQTLQSAKRIAYPDEFYEVIVVADNCSDLTAKIALGNGAMVFERFDKNRRGKGYALNWIIPQVLERLPHYDACVFVDADSIISENFLDEMNQSMEQGHQIIQSNDLVLDNESSWRVQLVLIAFALQNFVRPLGKSRLGLSISLKGNGMCFSRDVLRTLQWDHYSLGEDLDMGLTLLLQGVNVHFNPSAVVYALMPTQAASATTQRLRWEGGRFESIRTRVPKLLKEAWSKRSFRILEAAIDVIFPPLALFLMIAGGFVTLNGLMVWSGIEEAYLMFWAWLAIIGSLMVHCILGLILARVHPKNLLAFLYIPRFLLWKIGVYCKMMFRRTEKEWVRTAR